MTQNSANALNDCNLNRPWFFIACCDSAEKGFVPDHGLSIIIANSTQPPFLMLDTGSNSEILHNNLLQAGLHPDMISAVVISHGHYDHTGGLELLQEVSEPPFLYSSPLITVPRYHVSNGESRAIGLPEGVNLSRFPARAALEGSEVFPGVHSILASERATAFERCWDPLTLDTDGVIPDWFDDEVSLVMKIEATLVVFSGCSHRGIVNIVIHARKLFPCKNVVVVGGLHLRNAPKAIAEKTAAALKEQGVTHLFAGHCTGENHYPALEATFGDGFIPLKAGQVFRL